MTKTLLSVVAGIALMLALSPATSAAGHHPQIEAALTALQDARMHLIQAKHDFHGHRAEAVKSIDESIHQLRICMEFD